MFEPIYYLGWIIQPMSILGNCTAYERVDTCGPRYLSFGSVREAKRFIRSRVR